MPEYSKHASNSPPHWASSALPTLPPSHSFISATYSLEAFPGEEMTAPRGILRGRGGQSVWGIGLKEGKDAECEGDDEDGHSG